MSASATAQIHTDGLPTPRRYFAVAVLLSTLVLVVLDGAIANVALPSIARSLNAHPSDTVWVVSSYQMAVLVALLPCGALGEKLGPRRIYLIGVLLFTLASAGCTFATSLPMLVVARFVQGLGGGAIMGLASMNLRFSVPHRMLGTIIGFNAMTVAISSAAGPGIAGAILAVANWPWLFAVNLPLGIAVLAAGRLLPHTPGTDRSLDAAALVVNTAMFLLFFAGTDRIAASPFLGGALVAAGILCLFLLLRIERHSATPLVPTDLFRDPAFRIAVMASICCFAAQMLSYIALPFYLQHVLNMSPSQAGLYMMPWPIAVAIIAPIGGRLSHRFKTAWLCGIGGALLATGLLFVGSLPPQILVFLIGTVISGFGFGLFQTPNNRILLMSAPRARSGAAGAMQGTARLTGQTFGAVIMSAIFTLSPLTAAPGVALVVAGGCAVAGGLLSFSRARHETVE